MFVPGDPGLHETFRDFGEVFSEKLEKGPSDPGSPGTSISYLQPAVDRQPGHRRGDS